MYKVLIANTVSSLEDKVNLHLNRGWTLQGGVSVTDSPTVPTFCQAMVKYGSIAKVVTMYPETMNVGNVGGLPVPSRN